MRARRPRPGCPRRPISSAAGTGVRIHVRLMERPMERDDPWDENDGQELEAEIMRADHAFGVDLRGTTPEEELAGIGLEDALDRERPDGRRGIDQVVAVESDGIPDVEGELVA